MKKCLYMLLTLAVASATMSCEREILPNNVKHANDENVSEPEKMSVNSDILGYWTFATDAALADPEHRTDETIPVHMEFTFRFYEDGTGYLTYDETNLDTGLLWAYKRGGFKYTIEDDVLYMDRGENWDTFECKFSFNGQNLTLYDCNFININIPLSKTEDQDRLFIGYWLRDTPLRKGETLFDKQLTFASPTDGCVYKVIYDENTQRPVDDLLPAWFTYTFDDKKIVIKFLQDVGGYVKEYYYRIEGNKLYLTDTKTGEVTCYSDLRR